MPKLTISSTAQLDLEQILYFSIVTFGHATAEHYRSDLDEAIRRIGADPRVGRPAPQGRGKFMQHNCRSHGVL